MGRGMLGYVWDQIRALPRTEPRPKRIEATGFEPERDEYGYRFGEPTVTIGRVVHHGHLAYDWIRMPDGSEKAVHETRVETEDGLLIRIRHKDATQSPYAVTVYKDRSDLAEEPERIDR